MFFKPAFFIASLASFAVPRVPAAPAPENMAIEARGADFTQYDGHIYVCTDANWSGDCANLGIWNGGCLNFPSEFQYDISSIGPDAGWSCMGYIHFDCQPDGQPEFTIYNPGYSDLSAIGPYNYELLSVSCFN